MSRRIAFLAVTVVVVLLLAPGEGPLTAQQGDDDVLRLMQAFNDDLRPQWIDFRVEQIEMLTVGRGRPSTRLHQRAFRWVPDDPRRQAEAGALTYLVEPSWGTATASGVPQPVTERATDRAMAAWAESLCTPVTVLKRPAPGGDVTLFDEFLGPEQPEGPILADPFVADVVHAGWFPSGAADAILGPDVLAISVTFIFVDRETGEPTDLDGDGFLDTAANEIYYNDGFHWTAGEVQGGMVLAPGEEPTVDVETVALHEAGHAFGLGHFGSPPEAVMNPVYHGVLHQLLTMDHAGLCSLWGNWDHP